MRTYRDLPPVPFLHSDGIAISRDHHRPGQCHMAVAGTLVLHHYIEVLQPSSPTTDFGQSVSAGSLEVKGLAIKAEVVGVAGHGALALTFSIAANDATLHTAFLTSAAAGFLALQLVFAHTTALLPA